MGIRDFFASKGEGKKKHTYNVTSLGVTKAEEHALNGTKWEVLTYLNTNGPASINEIANAPDIVETVRGKPSKVKQVIKELISEGYVSRSGQEG